MSGFGQIESLTTHAINHLVWNITLTTEHTTVLAIAFWTADLQLRLKNILIAEVCQYVQCGLLANL